LSKALYGAEIFDVGTWPAQTGPVTVTLEDIDAIVASFEALGLSRKVPLKAGHNEKQPMTDGQPALGWVSRVWRQGTKLMADFVDMPTVIHEAIRTKRYKTVSIELLRNVQAGTRKIPWVLDAVSLLGADQPAVGTLKDLEALTMSRGSALRAGARVAFRREFQFTNSEARKGMEKHEVEAAIAAALGAQEVKFTSQLNALKTESAQALAAEQEKTRKAEVARHRDAVKSKFEAAVNKTILPATREQFYKFARVEDDASVMSIKLDDVDAYIKDNADKALLSKNAKQETQQGEAHEDEKGLRADQIVVKRAEKLCYSRQQDPTKGDHYMRAVSEVLRGDAKLADAYKYMPDTEYRQAS
jgi:hypothetical protein